MFRYTAMSMTPCTRNRYGKNETCAFFRRVTGVLVTSVTSSLLARSSSFWWRPYVGRFAHVLYSFHFLMMDLVVHHEIFNNFCENLHLINFCSILSKHFCCCLSGHLFSLACCSIHITVLHPNQNVEHVSRTTCPGSRASRNQLLSVIIPTVLCCRSKLELLEFTPFFNVHL